MSLKLHILNLHLPGESVFGDKTQNLLAKM